MIQFSPKLWADLQEIRAYLFKNMYRAPSVMIKRAEVTEIVNTLFPIYMAQPGEMPKNWQDRIAQTTDTTQLARIVADYLAGMTDRFAILEYGRLH